MNFKKFCTSDNINCRTDNDPAVNKISAIIIIIVLVSALFSIRMMTPDDLGNRDQFKVCSYILDASYNHHWVCQVDSYGAIASKPPLYNWIGALMVLLFGANRFSYALPACFGVMLASWAVFRWTLDLTRDERSAWLALLCYLVTNAVVKQTALIRTDGLFSGFVAVCAWQAWRAWESDHGWWRTWFLAGLGVLTKGPFAVLLGFGGLSAVFLNRQEMSYKALPRGWWKGIILPILLGGTWALAAWSLLGHAFFDKIFISELYEQSVGNAIGFHRFSSAIKPPLYLLSRALPWTPLFLWGLWHIFTHPEKSPEKRRGELYIVMHIGIGLLALMLAQHKRGDLVFPLLPAVAVLEGRMMGLWAQKWQWTKLKALLAVFTMVFILFEIWYLAVPRANDDEDRLGREIKAFARKIENRCGPFFPFSFASAHSLQYRLRCSRLSMKPALAAKLLSGRDAVFVVTEDLPAVISALPSDIRYFVLLRDIKHPYGVISNRPELKAEPDMVVGCGEWVLHTRKVTILRMRGTTARIKPHSGGRLTLDNIGMRPCTLKLILPGGKIRRIHAEAKSSVNFVL